MDQSGLPALPAAVWNSWEIRSAAAAGSPGAVVAFARKAHGLRQDELGTLAGFSQSAISRLESGSNLAYDTRILRTLQRLLGIPPRLLGLADAQAVGHAVEPATQGGPAKLANDPEQTVKQLLVTRRILNDADNWRRSESLKPAVRQLYQLADRVRRSATGQLRQDMLRVAALYAEFYGWLYQETGDLTGAGQWTARALEQGQAAGDPDTVAYAYVRMSQLAEVDGDPDRVIGLARAAQREHGVGDRVRTIGVLQESRGHARAGDERNCLTSLDKAAELAERLDVPDAEEYVIGYCFSSRHVELTRCACLVQLNRPRDAIREYERLRPTWSTVCPWEQGVHTAKLAVAHAQCGEFDAAAAVGAEAAEAARETGSVLVAGELRRLREWHDVPAIAELARVS